uniref:Hydroxylamine reductase n=1 Tax=Erythrolobus australicus TaxID=1077150 RepID=A0A7S1TP37_9RHOD|mmetsp:Transcript_521/g.1354  ORF Transcript_521/g.1354 Transcript_521/m.1354 type:complete len:636 (+) Transcript_521:109-2016(+)
MWTMAAFVRGRVLAAAAVAATAREVPWRLATIGTAALLRSSTGAAGSYLVRAAWQREMRTEAERITVAGKMAQSLAIFESAAAGKATAMACFQCEQTNEGKGCTVVGVCGKTPEVAGQQDEAISLIKAIAQHAVQLKSVGGQVPAHISDLVLETMFATLTNVNFDEERWRRYLDQLRQAKTSLASEAQSLAKNEGIELKPLSGAAGSGPVAVSVVERGLAADSPDPDIYSLCELLTYGLKGMMAYAEHARVLGKRDSEVIDFVYEALAYLGAEEFELGRLLDLCLKTGECNLKVMGLLNEGAIDRYDPPTPTKVVTTYKKGKCILVSGHDLRDLEAVLEATAGKGINVYTHGEMLPAHGYPKLKHHSHLIGNYGGAWQLQKFEFPRFPGPILVTTNCIVEPRKSYAGRIFTTNAVGYKNVTHLENRDFAPLVEQALAMDGFQHDETPEKFTMTGFGHHAVLGIADQVVSAIKDGKIKHFFLIGGCDGSEIERSYYADLADKVPKDCVILTLACGKYRFNKKFEEFGTIAGTGIPRILDVGQCNDAFSAVKIAEALANAFKTDINSLPLSIVLSWFEQKAVSVLLTLLALNVQKIRIGPALPAFVSPTVLNVLVDKFQLTPIADPAADLEAMMNGQ